MTYQKGYDDAAAGRPYTGTDSRYAAGYEAAKADAQIAAMAAAQAAIPSVPEFDRAPARAPQSGARFAFPAAQEGRDEPDNTIMPTGGVF